MSKSSILIVDDEPSNFAVIETLLSNESYNVYYVNSGVEALASLDAYNPDLILLDMLMSKMNGLEVCARIKLMRKWRSIPIIMMTSLSGETAIEKCVHAGADDFISKPVHATELRARVKSMLRIKKQFDRIESFTKLQQHKISLLESNLAEFGADIAIGFANELNAPLRNVVGQLDNLTAQMNANGQPELLGLVNSGKKSVTELEQLIDRFWVYIELAMEGKQFVNSETCEIKEIVEQIAQAKFQFSDREQDISLNLVKANLAVTNQHCELIVKELLDNVMQFSQAGNQVELSGWIADRQFHLQVNDQVSSNLVDRTEEEQELFLSLKIVKKVVSIYDGHFLFSCRNQSFRSVHITLPIA
jgi:two-component system, sensor histidine kinase and response regulator